MLVPANFWSKFVISVWKKVNRNTGEEGLWSNFITTKWLTKSKKTKKRCISRILPATHCIMNTNDSKSTWQKLNTVNKTVWRFYKNENETQQPWLKDSPRRSIAFLHSISALQITNIFQCKGNNGIVWSIKSTRLGEKRLNFCHCFSAIKANDMIINTMWTWRFAILHHHKDQSKHLLFQIRQFPLRHIWYRLAAHTLNKKKRVMSCYCCSS